MRFPKITIVTPNFNGAKYLEKTIESVLSQNYPNLEYIIIDGGSTDGSVEIIRKYEKNIAYWVSESDNGIYHAIQKGFDRSTGELMAWINSDDMYHPNSFYTVAEIFSSYTNIRWIVGTATTFDSHNRTIIAKQSRVFSKFDFYNQDYGWIQQESVFWRRSLWNETGGSVNLDLKYAGDFALWLKFISVENLFVTTALIGGFRWQGKNQLSIDFKADYFKEIDLVYRNLKLNKDETLILRKYKNILTLQNLLRKLKFFKDDWIVRKFKTKYFGPPQKVIYDSKLLKFKIVNHKY